MEPLNRLRMRQAGRRLFILEPIRRGAGVYLCALPEGRQCRWIVVGVAGCGCWGCWRQILRSITYWIILFRYESAAVLVGVLAQSAGGTEIFGAAVGGGGVSCCSCWPMVGRWLAIGRLNSLAISGPKPDIGTRLAQVLGEALEQKFAASQEGLLQVKAIVLCRRETGVGRLRGRLARRKDHLALQRLAHWPHDRRACVNAQTSVGVPEANQKGGNPARRSELFHKAAAAAAAAAVRFWSHKTVFVRHFIARRIFQDKHFQIIFLCQDVTSDLLAIVISQVGRYSLGI